MAQGTRPLRTTRKPPNRSVFINCPFDLEYRSLFEVIVFTVVDCGYLARCALEIDDSGETRIEKILRLIAECRIGVHDVSRVEFDRGSGLPRFNMPLELGLFLGARAYGDADQKRKRALILERDRYQAKRYLSDLAGHDFKAHDGDPARVVSLVRDTLYNDRLSSDATGRRVDAAASLGPGAAAILERFHPFEKDLERVCRDSGNDRDGLSLNQFKEFNELIFQWIDLNKY